MKKTENKDEPAKAPDRITRREFNGFFLLGSLLSFMTEKIPLPPPAKEAMFWKKTDA